MSKHLDDEIRLAKRIEAGLLAQEILEGGTGSVMATTEELRALVEEGRQAKEDLIMAHLGLVRVIAAETSRIRRVPFADLFQEGCVALQQAVMSYDWRKGAFGPYAGMWVRSTVRRVNTTNWMPIDQVEVEDPTPSQACDRSVTHDGLAQVLELIPSSQRKVLRLRTGWDGQPHSRRDVAVQLGMTVSKVRHLERVGLESMRRHWETLEAA